MFFNLNAAIGQLINSKALEYLGIENGLSNNSVTQIFQDHYGFIWIGTFDGLNRYDGNNFKIYRNKYNDSTSVIHNHIITIAEDKENRIWIGTKVGASVFDNTTGKFSSPVYVPYNGSGLRKVDMEITDIETDQSGDILMATAGKGLLLGRKGSKKLKQVSFYKQNGIVTDYNVNSVKFFNTHAAWLFIEGSGLCEYDIITNKIKIINAEIINSNFIMPDKMGNVWFSGIRGGLYKYTSNDKKIIKYSQINKSLISNNIVSFTFDKSGNLWISTDGDGVNIINGSTNKLTKILPSPAIHSLTSPSISAVFEDKESRMWIGTSKGGINIIDAKKNRFTNITHNSLTNNSLVSGFVNSFCEDGNNLWIGTDGGGISRWARKSDTYSTFTHQIQNPGSLSSNSIPCIIKDDLGDIWIATFGTGINKYNKIIHTFTQYKCINTASHFEDKFAWRLYQDRYKNIWAGTSNGGALYKLNRILNKFELYDEHLTNVITLKEDSFGTLWAGTYKNLIKLDTINKKHLFLPVRSSVRDIVFGKNGNIWIGTENAGLVNYNVKNNRFNYFNEDNGLPSHAILNIQEDKSGCLWMSTYNGISKFNPETKKFVNFYQSDGLQSNQFSYNAGLKLSTGEIVFGGMKGFNIFNPDSIKFYTSSPKLLLTDLRINNQSIENNKAYTKGTALPDVSEITIPFDKTTISIDFAALEYSFPDKIIYQWFLSGWDNRWSYPSKIKTANYSRLSEGVYILNIMSTNEDGIGKPSYRTIKIIVLPPFYRTWWAYALYFLSLSGLIFAYNTYRVKQTQLKHEVEIANIKIEKEKDINERKLSFFTNISHEFRTPLTLIINPLKDFLYGKQADVHQSDLHTVYRNANRLLSLVDQLLLFRRAEADEDKLKILKLNFPDLCKEVFLCFASSAKSKKIQYIFECNNNDIEIYADREKIEIALFNLLSNAFKFTPEGGKICVCIINQPTCVDVHISDTGPGIPLEVGDQLFDKFFQVPNNKLSSIRGFGIGLFLVKKFIDSHKGKITYTTKIGEGTTFSINLIKGTTHLSTPYIFENPSEYSFITSESIEINDFGSTEDPNKGTITHLTSNLQTLLIIDDNQGLRNYIKSKFCATFNVIEAADGDTGFDMVYKYVPDIIISDVSMPGLSGIELCTKIKNDASIKHIPVILLTSSSSSDIKLKGIECGADDYITKPFDLEFLTARIFNILKSRNNIQKYFFNEITLNSQNHRISPEYKEFLNKCIEIIERNISNPEFNTKMLTAEIGMSYSNLFKKVKSISGKSINEFIRFIKLRKAAGLLINTDSHVNEVAFKTGFSDVKYFREQFHKVFDMNPSDYIKKYRKNFHNHQG